ncbi:cytochrome c [Psychrobacter sp. CAL346-MNA-CIBAN-0220]|uniref:c-type cytochrome n=1 Tax=Psychrobacter sp. CAL346-MNA-CIBAN-0220 TaxID=3140457 RepID=UPI00331CF91F
MNYSKYPLMTLLASISLSMAALSGCSSKDADSATLAQPAAQPNDSANLDNSDNPNAFNVQASRNNGAWGAVYMSRDELRSPPGNIVDVSVLPTMSEDADIKKWDAKFENASAFVTKDGEKLYHDSCAACHMHKGEGAIGAGYYPPLADNSKMESKYYVISILINGFRGMPSFHRMMDDEQMAAVTQYVRSELNDYKDPVTAADVLQLRHANPPGGDASDH